jgi:Domain of unknown function (DUF5666)
VMIGVYTVVVNSGTQFSAGACRDVAVGTMLDVVGYFVADTVVTASRIGIVK